MNSEEKYIAVYGRDGTHISNIQLSKWNITRKVFDLDVSNFEGSCDDDITTGLIFVMNDKYGNKEYSGFMKSIIQDKKTGHVTFKGEDFKKIFDTDIMLDFTDQSLDYRYQIIAIFTLVSDAVEDQASSLFTLNFNIPVDITYTYEVALFDGSYFYTNALSFLKTYLAYYSYYITVDYDIANKEIDFEFVKTSTSKSIRLTDFIFTQTLSEVKTNHTVARLKFNADNKDKYVWINTSKDYYNAQPTDEDHRGTIFNSTDPYDFFLRPDQLLEGFALQVYSMPLGDSQAIVDYYKVAKVEHVWVPTTSSYYDYVPAGSKSSISVPEPMPGTPQMQTPDIDAESFPVGYAYKIDYVTNTYTSDRYFRVFPNAKSLPSTITEKHYYLGIDNEIYESTIDAVNQIYPVVTKYFEDEFLAKAQFNAIWELVNSRYNETVSLDKISAPVDITAYNLFDMITVYDSNGDYKQLPVSEIIWTQDSYKVKLGFKKERFTDIVKEATGTKITGAISTKYSGKLIRDIGRLGNLSDIK